MDTDNGVVKEIKFFLIAGIFDKPARACALNMIASYGFSGCTKCFQPGESFRTIKGIELISFVIIVSKFALNVYLGGVTHIYRFNVEDPDGPQRTDESFLNDAEEA